jgi:hypothetical protein
MVLVAFACAVRLSQSGARKDLVCAGVAAGLAASTKYNGGIVALPVLFAALAGASVAKPIASRLADAALAVALMIAAFLGTSPYTVIEFQRFSADFLSDAQHLTGGHGIDLGRGWVYHATTTLRYGIGLPLLVSGAAGMMLLIWRDVRKGVLVALFPVVYYLILGSGYTVFTRHMIPVVPFLCLTGGYFLAEIAAWIAARLRRPAWRTPLTAAAVALALLPSVRSIVMFDALLARADSRLLARQWVERWFPPGTTIAQIGPDGGHVFHHDASEVSYTTVELSRTGARPDLVIVQSSPLTGPDELGDREAVVKAEYTRAFAQHAADDDPRNVYDRQDEFYMPLSGFHQIERPGPNLEIFVRKDIAEQSSSAGGSR